MTVQQTTREKLEEVWGPKAGEAMNAYNAVDLDVELAKMLAEVYDLPLDEVNEFVQEKKLEAKKA